MLPTAADIAEGIQASEREEEQREAWLRSAPAKREREQSRLAFADLGSASAGEILNTVFGSHLAQLNADPARALGDAQLLAVQDETAATVREDGDTKVLESSMPLRTEDEDGDLGKVDVGLEATADGFETRNALADVRIPASAERPVEVGDHGVSIKLVGADEGRALQPFGEQNALASEVLTDTDMLVSPIASGVEIFNLLRSERSPETVRYQVGMPPGAVLRAGDGQGAEVVREGKLLATIPEPVAVDAQGTDVPVGLQIEGDSLLLTVEHREGDYAMPILLDPAIEDSTWWVYGQNLDALHESIWGFSKNVAGIHGSTHCIYHCWGLSNPRGLFVSAQSGTYWAWQYGHWFYAAPNQHSYVSGANFHPFVRYDHGCNAATTTYKQPHDYVGLWDGSDWAMLHTNKANHPAGGPTVTGVGQSVVMGLSTAESNFSIPCWRDVYLQGAYVSLDDWGPPVLESVTGIPSGWVSDETQYTIGAQAFDQGLGVQNIAIHPQGWNEFHNEPQQDQCSGHKRDLCSHTYAASFPNPGARFLEGERTGNFLQAYDPTLKPSANHNFTTRVDKTPPSVSLEGQLAEVTEEDEGEAQGNEEVEKLRLPVYNLTVKATDGDPDGEDKHKRSGVKDIEIYLDGVEQEVPWGPQACPGPDYSCPMTKTYPVALSRLDTAGVHTLKVEAVDQVGKRKKRQIEFEYFPATGMKDEYAMHYFPLPDGQGDEESEEHPARPELAVNVMNGNLVYREQDVDVEGVAVDLEVERYYNSQLPEAEDTEWGDGWTLAQTPDLKPEEGATPAQAELVDTSGALEEEVELPTEVEEETFDPELQATLRKKEGGGYELTDETGESATSVAFDATGQTEARLTEGQAKVDYTYEEGELAEIAVEDPGTVGLADPSELQIPEAPPPSPPSFSYAFGLAGDEEGEFEWAADVAVGPQGDTWVVDAEANRVQHFGPLGNYLGEFGSEGSGDGQFQNPFAIEIDAAGDLWVLDTFNNRLQKFNQQGEFLAKWGSSGSAPGKLNAPQGLAIDAEGDLWVSDSWNGRIQKFSPTGSLLAVAGTSGEGELDDPAGLDIGPEGEVFVADWAEHRIVVFDKEGGYERQFGAEGTGEGQLRHPATVEVDAQGGVWVADEFDEELEHFDAEGAFIAQLGSEGSGDGEFDFTRPMGIASDAEGLWIVDTGNHRLQRWGREEEDLGLEYDAALGSPGTGNGQFDLPGDADIDSEGDIWVVDTANDRVQQLDPEGGFISKFGAEGSADGQLQRPSAIEIDAQDNLWVADAGNDRVQKFSPAGQFLAKFGGSGSGDGKLDSPEGLAIAPNGDIWVSDTWHDRVQRFSAAGEFLSALDTTGEGALGEPAGIDVVFGEVFVADNQHDGIAVFNTEGEYLREFGSQGYGQGQFRFPSSLEIDDGGKVWVGDEGNERILLFDIEGEFILDFASEGTGEAELELTPPSGIATDTEGGVWVADSGNDRLQRWQIPDYVPAPEPELTDGDPAVQVETQGELVSSVVGNAAGSHEYEHDGELLTAHEGPEGESAYEYDAEDRLSKVTLPNGTWASIAYFPDDRVKSVTVDVAEDEKAAKTTYFEYSEEPRRTFVEVPGAPNLTYDFAEDGSLLKWWHKQQPPEFLSISGSLWIEKGKELPIGDHTLQVIADSPEGIDSIQFIANGDILVDEMTCEQDPEKEGVECTELENVWVTDTASNIPGRLDIEVIVTDSDGNSESERFWVEVPYTPPPPAGVPIAPKFKEIERFREEYGLEVVFPVANELELVERIFDLIHAWHSPYTYEGQVARASAARWGVPLRPADVAELEYREWLYDVNAEKIDQWVEATSPGSYAGYTLDHAAGGIMRIGFLGNQEEQLANLETSLSLVESSRLSVYPTPPTTSYLSVRATTQSVMGAIESNPTLANLVISVEDDEAGRATRIGTPNVAQVEGILDQMVGLNAPVAVEYEASGGVLLEGRYRNEGRMRAGDYINGTAYTPKGIPAGDSRCTAGFGAEHRKKRPKSNGGEIVQLFLLTAGHCYSKIDQEVWRNKYDGDFAFPYDDAGKSEVGRLQRNAIEYVELGGVRTDGAAIRIKQGGIVPRDIWAWDGHPLPTKPPGKARKRNVVCYSGAISKNVACGKIVARSWNWHPEDAPHGLAGYWVIFPKDRRPVEGDSGAPVWNKRTGASIGLVSGSRPPDDPTETLVAPLLHPPNMPANRVPGILHHWGMAPLKLKVGG